MPAVSSLVLFGFFLFLFLSLSVLFILFYFSMSCFCYLSLSLSASRTDLILHLELLPSNPLLSSLSFLFNLLPYIYTLDHPSSSSVSAFSRLFPMFLFSRWFLYCVIIVTPSLNSPQPVCVIASIYPLFFSFSFSFLSFRFFYHHHHSFQPLSALARKTAQPIWTIDHCSVIFLLPPRTFSFIFFSSFFFLLFVLIERRMYRVPRPSRTWFFQVFDVDLQPGSRSCLFDFDIILFFIFAAYGYAWFQPLDICGLAGIVHEPEEMKAADRWADDNIS